MVIPPMQKHDKPVATNDGGELARAFDFEMNRIIGYAAHGLGPAQMHQAACCAVGRAVVPPHFAVYDTRTHVVVEKSAIADAVTTLTESFDDEIAMECVFGWLRDIEREAMEE